MSPGALRLERQIRAAAHGRSLTLQEQEILRSVRPARKLKPVGPQSYEGSLAMLPVAQLYVRDIPDLHAPEGADLLQVLWCPFDHPVMPRTALFWRSAATVADILTSPPEPPAVQFKGYLPEPCVINPEQVTEYPSPMELSQELREQLANWSLWQAADTGVDSSYAPYPQEFYQGALSVAPGWKVGGWPSWGPTDPVPRLCPTCDSEMHALLTIDSLEGNDTTHSWLPAEEPTTCVDYFDPRQPTAVQIGSGYKQQLYICPAAPEHPHIELMQ
jgi:hypothetical protein